MHIRSRKSRCATLYSCRALAEAAAAQAQAMLLFFSNTTPTAHSSSSRAPLKGPGGEEGLWEEGGRSGTTTCC